jgi:ankyrin repeat protein
MHKLLLVFVSNNPYKSCNYLAGTSAIHRAVLSQDLSTLRILLRAGANINSTDVQGDTPLHHAVDENNNLEIVCYHFIS